MVIMDTAEDWRWWLESWQYVLDVAEVTARDRVFMAFSFGPFIGFWSAHDACLARGAMVVPAGGMTSLARLQWLESMRASVVCCTPSYALHLAEVARQQGMDLAGGSTDRLIVAGEPGGSIPEIRKRIEYEWGARVIDHAGATEVGAWSYGTEAGDGLEIIESEFIAEFLPLENVARFETPASTRPASMLGEEPKELVLTALGRVGAPVLRYRTGDVVVPYWNADQQGFVRLLGGICGRADDMLIVRGVNVFPSSIEAILRGFPEVAEYRMTVTRQGALDQVRVEVEDGLRDPARIARALESRLGLRIDVHIAPSGSLPRFEAKAQRMVDLRHL
jgi:phenylacetate-CoA ligase